MAGPSLDMAAHRKSSLLLTFVLATSPGWVAAEGFIYVKQGREHPFSTQAVSVESPARARAEVNREDYRLVGTMEHGFGFEAVLRLSTGLIRRLAEGQDFNQGRGRVLEVDSKQARIRVDQEIFVLHLDEKAKEEPQP